MLENLISMTVAGGVAGLTLMLFKPALVRRSKALYFACLAVMLLFLVPIRPSLVPRSAQKLAPATEETVLRHLPEESSAPAEYITEETGEKETEPVMQEVGFTPFTGQEIMAFLWLLGAAVIFARYLVSYRRFRKKILGSGEQTEAIGGLRVFFCPVSSPLLLGFIRPVLVMPKEGLSEEDYILAAEHELTHWRHRDPWIKLLAAAINALHWFNPMAYALVHILDEACEYTCDSAVVRKADEAYRKRYSLMILELAERMTEAAPALSDNLARNKKQLSRRFKLIMKKHSGRKITAVITAASIVLSAFVSAALADAVAPTLSGIFEKGYVRVGTYYTENPVIVDGELYLPLERVLCDEGRDYRRVKPEHIIYDGNKVKIEVWTRDIEMNYIKDGEPSTFLVPGEKKWELSFEIGSLCLDAADRHFELGHAPILRDGAVYVPYELLSTLRDYEKLYQSYPGGGKFNFVHYAFDSLRNEYRSDTGLFYMQYGEETQELLNVDAVVSKSGLRTQFHFSADYTYQNGEGEDGSIEIDLERVTRLYAYGSCLEGLFTVKVNGETAATGQRGYINNLPDYSGDYEVYVGKTAILVEGYLTGFIDFNNREAVASEADSAAKEALKNDENARRYTLVPTEVRLADRRVTAVESVPRLEYNKQSASMSINFIDEYAEWERNNYNVSIDSPAIITAGNDRFFCDMSFKRTGRGICLLDRFSAEVTIGDGSFSIVSDDGQYIIRGILAEYVDRGRDVGNIEVFEGKVYRFYEDEDGDIVSKPTGERFPEIMMIED